MTNPLDFTGKTALIVGGSSGIGNGIAHAYREAGANVHVWGTRPSASDYDGDDGSDLTGLSYSQVDVSRFDQLDNFEPDFTSLDMLVLCQGTVLYKRQEFERDGWDRVMDVNINSVMHTAQKFPFFAGRISGKLDHREFCGWV